MRKKEPALKIQDLTPKEIRQVYSLNRNVPQLHESQSSQKYTLKELEEWLKNPQKDILLVAKKEKTVAGFLACRLLAPYWAEIDTLVVNPLFRRKGTGSALVQECLKRLKKKKIKEVSVSVRKRFPTISKFWRKQGFQEGYQFTLMEKFLTIRYC